MKNAALALLTAVALLGTAAPAPTSDVRLLSPIDDDDADRGALGGGRPNTWRLVDPLTPGPGGERGLSGPAVADFPKSEYLER